MFNRWHYTNISPTSQAEGAVKKTNVSVETTMYLAWGLFIY